MLGAATAVGATAGGSSVTSIATGVVVAGGGGTVDAAGAAVVVDAGATGAVPVAGAAVTAGAALATVLRSTFSWMHGGGGPVTLPFAGHVHTFT